MPRLQQILATSARLLAPLLILIMGMGVLLVFGRRPDVPRREMDGDRSPLVETVEVTRFEGALPLEVEGVAVPYRMVRLSAEVDGRITEKGPDTRAGSYVQQGQFLLQIDPAEYDLAVRRLKAQVRQAEQDLRAVEIDIANTGSLIDLARQELELRRAELARREEVYDKEVITDSELDEARRLELVARNALQTLENALATARQRKATLQAARERVDVELQRAELDRRRTRIVSPLTGTIMSDLVEENDFVRKGDQLVVLNDTSRVEIKCTLRMDQLYWLWLQAGIGRPGEPMPSEAIFELPSTPVEVVYRLHGDDFIWKGVLSRYEGQGIDEKTRTVPCRVRIDAPTRVEMSRSGDASRSEVVPPTLFSGMYVKVRVPVTPPVALLTVPAAAVRPGNRVWLVRDGKLRIETVELVQAGRETDILRRPPGDRLRAGDRVVVSPLPHAAAGMPVTEVAAR